MSNPGWTGSGRRLGEEGDDQPDPTPSSSSSQPTSARQTRQPASGLRTLSDLQNQGGSGHAHDDDGDDSDEDYKDDNQDFFAGGEKSGLAVQNPASGRDHIDNILRRARANVPRIGGEDEPRPASHFRGTGMTLGGDDTPSVAVPDPNASSVPESSPRVTRELHLWRDGFSVDDGPLCRYDDPAHARTLELINSGHAPLDILNVQPNQEVDVEVHPHREEDYKKPKRKYMPFSGTGQRLGSPTPGAVSTPPPAPAAGAGTTAGTGSATPATVNVDESVPTVTLQIRLGDGTRLQSRFNTTHTIGDVYGFVNAANPASTQRGYVLMTTFPSRELTDHGAVLGEMADFKRGGVVVQKWT